MSDREPDNLVVTMLCRLDAKLDRVIDDLSDIKHRVTSVERQVADLRVDTVNMSARIDRIELRLDRIERRLDLVDAQ